MEDCLNELLELVRQYDEANGTDRVPDQVKMACIISNTPEPLKTHLQLNVAKLGNFNAFRVATEGYLRSRRIFKTTSGGNTHDEDSMEVDAISQKRERQRTIGQGQEGWQERKRKATQAKVTVKRRQNTRASRVSVETAESTDTKLLTVGTSSRPNIKAKGRAQGSRNPKSQKSVKVTAVNKSKKPRHQTRLHRKQICLK